MGANFDNFYDAEQARSISRGAGAPLGVILVEIQALQSAIDTTVVASGLSITIAGSTPMTSSTTYFQSFQYPLNFQSDENVLCRSRMYSVVQYFTRLGYRVQRQRTGTTEYMQWVISW